LGVGVGGNRGAKGMGEGGRKGRWVGKSREEQGERDKEVVRKEEKGGVG